MTIHDRKPQPIYNAIHDFSNSDPKGTSGHGSSNQNPSSQQNPQMGFHIMPPPGAEADDPLELLINYNEQAQNNEFATAYFRDSQISTTAGILDKLKKPNALLTGPAGVGKTQIVEEIANRIVNKDPLVYGLLGDVTIYELPLSNIVAGSGVVGSLETKVKNVIEFVSDPSNNAILFIDEIHQLTKESGSDSYSKIAEILKPAMGRSGMRMIGATTTQEARTIMNNSAFSRRWTEVVVPELTEEQTASIIESVIPKYQAHHNVVLPNNLVTDLVRIADEFKRPGSHRPDTALTLLDKAMSDTKINHVLDQEKAKTDPNFKIILNAMLSPIGQAIVRKNQIKRSAQSLLTDGMDTVFRDNTDDLEANLASNIIGQERAKEAIVSAVKRLGLRLSKKTRPSSFLFAGPSGVGKTEIAKILTESVFNNANHMVYVNMSEFSNDSAINRIIGSPKGYVGSTDNDEKPFDVLKSNPYQVVLLDEFEKGHRNVQRLFMQALDEGHVKDNQGQIIDFSRAIIIATTNAGAEDFQQAPVGFVSSKSNQDASHTDIVNALKQDFDVELINRFEHVIPFDAMTESDYRKILAVKYNKIIAEAIDNRNDLDFSPAHIDIEDADNYEVLVDLAKTSYNPNANGRPAERTIRQYIEDTVLDNPNQTKFNLL